MTELKIERSLGAVADLPVHPEREARIKLVRSGRAVIPNLTAAFDLTIQDISIGGAKLKLASGVDLPREFYLLMKCKNGRDHVRRTCEKRWQVGNRVGVRFQTRLGQSKLAAVLDIPASPDAS